MSDETVNDPATSWVLRRLDRALDRSARELLDVVADELSIATGDAVTVRRLSDDGTVLLPVVASHPEATWKAALQEAMTMDQRTDEGLWGRVVTERRPVRWAIDPAALPTEATAGQVGFLTRHPVRAVLGVPVLLDGTVVGGMSLVRFVAGRAYGDREQALLVSVADRVAPILHYVV